MSFSRPDPASPAAVADASFGTSRRGFDQSEVREFLRMVAAELGRLQERERFLERELRTAQTSPDLDSARLDDETLTRLLGEETARVLNTARESAAEIRNKAEEAASRILAEANDEANRLREEAELESSRRRADAAADAEAELSMAKQQGREMVNEARAYRERVLSELARRRELAREQIEQLVHGRDRLMQAFERARLVAVDVVAEMQPLGEPDEYVNLAPTTGPVPVMVARESEAAVTDGGPPTQPVARVDAETVDAETAADTLDAETDADTVAAETDDETLDAETDAETVAAETDDETVAAETDADADDAVSDADTAAAAEPVADDAQGVDDVVETTEVDAPDTDRPTDDVVVDLFARLRAGAPVDDAADEHDAAIDSEAADRAAADDGDPAPTSRSIAVGELDGDDAEEFAESTPFEQRDADLTPLIVSSAKKLKRVLADEQNEVLDALRRSDPVRNLDTLLPWSSEHVARYTSAINDDLLMAAQAGASLVTPDRVAKLAKTASKHAVGEANGVLEQWLVTPLRDRLERCIADGDGDNAAITKKVRAVYREWKTRHIDEQLDDIVRTAHGRGLLAGLDPDQPVAWTVDARHGGCPDCDDNALAGVVAAGQPFPTGHTFAPAHPGCRCLLVPADR